MYTNCSKYVKTNIYKVQINLNHISINLKCLSCYSLAESLRKRRNEHYKLIIQLFYSNIHISLHYHMNIRSNEYCKCKQFYITQRIIKIFWSGVNKWSREHCKELISFVGTNCVTQQTTTNGLTLFCDNFKLWEQNIKSVNKKIIELDECDFIHAILHFLLLYFLRTTI